MPLIIANLAGISSAAMTAPDSGDFFHLSEGFAENTVGGPEWL